MIEITFRRTDVNVEALDEQLRVGVGAAVLGVSTGSENMRVFMAESATQEQQEQARAIVGAHRPEQLTARQRTQRDAEQELKALRRANQTALDAGEYDSSEAQIVKLAGKVAWLEREIRLMRIAEMEE